MLTFLFTVHLYVCLCVWLQIYQTLHKCTIQGSRRPLPYPGLCTKNEVITDSMIPNDSTVMHTVIAVYMVAQGLNGIQSCKGSNLDIAACIITLSNRNQAIYQVRKFFYFSVLFSAYVCY